MFSHTSTHAACHASSFAHCAIDIEIYKKMYMYIT